MIDQSLLIPPPPVNLNRFREMVRKLDSVRCNGIVTQVIGLVVESTGPSAQIGEICNIHYSRSKPPMRAEVVGFKSNRVLLMPLGDMVGIRAGAEVVATGHTHQVTVSDALLGRVLDGLGDPMDGKPLSRPLHQKLYDVNATPPNALTRRRITEPITVGVRAVD